MGLCAGSAYIFGAGTDALIVAFGGLIGGLLYDIREKVQR
jgi:hypothetical protein